MITISLKVCLKVSRTEEKGVKQFVLKFLSIIHTLKLPDSLKSQNCPQPALQILLAILCSVICIVRTLV